MLPPQKMEGCVLIPSVNQNLAKQGLMIDRVDWERRELGRPAARLRFFSPHKSCSHSHVIFQKPAGTRLGYVMMSPVIQPTLSVGDADTTPPPNHLGDDRSPAGPESGPKSGSPDTNQTSAPDDRLASEQIGTETQGYSGGTGPETGSGSESGSESSPSTSSESDASSHSWTSICINGYNRDRTTTGF